MICRNVLRSTKEVYELVIIMIIWTGPVISKCLKKVSALSKMRDGYGFQLWVFCHLPNGNRSVRRGASKSNPTNFH